MYDIYHDIQVSARPQEIFDAISTPQGLNAWWTVRSSGVPVVGSTYNFYFSEDYNWSAEVSSYDQNGSISFRMTYATNDWINTRLNFIILQQDGYCILRFEHKGWQEPSDHYRRTSYCWALYLKCLKDYVENGIIKPYNHRTL
jgi:uncharacterized protein YndB with AHSA1/START domain